MVKEKKIAMGFSGIAGVGEEAYAELKKYNINKITKEEFFGTHFSKFSKTSFEACLKAKIFDDWSTSREELKELRKLKINNSKQLNLFGETEFETSTKMLNKRFLATSEQEKEKDFLEICGIDLKLMKKIANLKQAFFAGTGVHIEPFTNFDAPESYYYFLLEAIHEKKTKNNRPYFECIMSDGSVKKKLIMWDNFYKRVESMLEVGNFYVTKFKKEKGWMNFDTEAKFRKFSENK
jgi:DNA polymerase III alpha subunit